MRSRQDFGGSPDESILIDLAIAIADSLSEVADENNVFDGYTAVVGQVFSVV